MLSQVSICINIAMGLSTRDLFWMALDGSDVSAKTGHSGLSLLLQIWIALLLCSNIYSYFLYMSVIMSTIKALIDISLCHCFLCHSVSISISFDDYTLSFVSTKTSPVSWIGFPLSLMLC